MANKVGNLIKKARTEAGLSQAALAKAVDGLSASELSKAENGELKLSNEVLKSIAKATGVTQKSLVEAAASSRYSASGTKKAASTATTAKKTTGESVKVTATEKKLLELYRSADSQTRKQALAVLKGEDLDSNDILTSVINKAVELFTK